jgi:hypothetical protein
MRNVKERLQLRQTFVDIDGEEWVRGGHPKQAVCVACMSFIKPQEPRWYKLVSETAAHIDCVEVLPQ